MKNFTSFYKDTPIEHVTLPPGITYPVKYAVIRRKVVNNTFGMVRRRANGTKRPHQGWDFYAPGGYRCYAISDGTVTAVRNRGALGLHVLLEFYFDQDANGVAEKLYATYCHLSRADVKVGQKVKKGEQIGLTGDSGNARGMRGTDAHLHFEIRTSKWAGLGLGNRFSPLSVFKEIPLRTIQVTDPELVP